MSDSPDIQQILNTYLAGYRQNHILDGRRSQVCGHIQQSFRSCSRPLPTSM